MAKVVWERKTTGRIGQAHVFDGEGRSLCRTSRRTEEWVADKAARKCATCRRHVDPDNAPKAPSWRRPA